MDVNKWKWMKWAVTEIRLHRVTSKNAEYIFEELHLHFFPVSFFPLLLRILTENRTKLAKVRHKFANMRTLFYFLSTFVLRNHSKRRGNQNEHGKGNNPYAIVLF